MSFTPNTIADGNIAVIWVDDMIDVYSWRSAFGVDIQTPHLDAFMAAGARFSNAYATVPLCAPCRAELATGISPFRSGLVDLNRYWRDIYPPEKAWAYDLRRAGFYNFTTGKVDANYKPMPTAYSRTLFHEDVPAKDRGKRNGVHEYLDKGPGIKGVNHPDDDGGQDHKFYDFHVAQNAIDFLGRADPNRRTLIQLGFKHPHYNLVTPDRFYQQYDVDAICWPDSASDEDYYGPPPDFGVYEAAYVANGNFTPEKSGDHVWRNVVRGYFAAISHVDHEIGRFLEALKSSALGSNTTVIFLSDNGFNLGTHDSFHKMSQWDSAAHIPLGIWHPHMEAGQVIDLPVSLHNIPKTIMELAGLPPRPDWVSGQSLLPLVSDCFGEFDRSKSPITSVFGTLSVRPSVEGYTQYRYFRYPNGEEHVYDLIDDPGETTNLVDTAPMDILRNELMRGALDLGLDLRADLAGGVIKTTDDTQQWAYGADSERVTSTAGTLWYMAGPDDYTMHCPADVAKVRVGTVVARSEADGKTGKSLNIVANPDSAMEFETSERVSVNITGSNQGDVMYGPTYANANFYGGGGNDQLIALSGRTNSRHEFYGGAGDDMLVGGGGRDVLDGGTGNDTIFGGSGRNEIYGGHGNDYIEDGEGTSVIHTGPGRNTLNLWAGDDDVTIGTGVNVIDPGAGAVIFRVAYGGATVIRDWDASHHYDLSTWPGTASVKRHGKNRWRIRTGLSIVDVYNVENGRKFKTQITHGSAR
ncbi:MAG: sulfatase-like hydrolase/transferase [Planktomarina sp.]